MQLKYPASPSGLPRIRNNRSRFLARNICIVKTSAGSCDSVITMSHRWISFQHKTAVATPNHNVTLLYEVHLIRAGTSEVKGVFGANPSQ